MQEYSFVNFVYVIKPGDNLWLLSQRFGVPINEVLAANPHINPNNLYVGQIIHIPGAKRPKMPPPIRNKYSKSEFDLYNAFRLLWEQHVFWTRLAIISIINGSADEDVTTKRYLRNATDIQMALEPYYGTQKAAKVGNLLKEHLTIAGELVKAAKSGDSIKAADAEKRWYANADEIATYLSSINPYYNKNEWSKMLNEHLALTKKEAVDILTKNYAASIEDFDNIEKQALMMADEMAKGIIRQFPQRFI